MGIFNPVSFSSTYISVSFNALSLSPFLAQSLIARVEHYLVMSALFLKIPNSKHSFIHAFRPNFYHPIFPLLTCLTIGLASTFRFICSLHCNQEHLSNENLSKLPMYLKFFYGSHILRIKNKDKDWQNQVEVALVCHFSLQ